ncbi:4165_t:CDS:10 [Diversispora eburnea]|uniref:ATP-dependent RNA helicase n=1 Tax=Diversispora eburnea TaxID=1213867 RepID=A0A9N8UYL9_9GLOM|nr:4165_t:CDS:10 [Diversispora eburnea]
MDNMNLILNFVTHNSNDSNSEISSIRSKLKGVRGGWREKSKVRKSLKKNATNSIKNSQVLEKLYKKSKLVRHLDLNNSKKQQNHENNDEKKEKNSHYISNINNINNISSNGLTRNPQIISSIFTNNPKIINIPDDEIKSENSKNSNQNNQSNHSINNNSSFIGTGLNSELISNVKKKLGIEKPTNIQQKAIPILLNSINDDADVFIQAETGSGKTLAYLFPIVQRLMFAEQQNTQDTTRNSSFSRNIGTLVIILTPTRELAKQILLVINSLINIPSSKLSTLHLTHWIVPGSIIGGEKKQSEKARLRKGINILVSTPGRLLDHLQTTKSFIVKHLRWLVLDEADRLLELGFEEKLQSILKILDEKSNDDDIQNQLPFTSSSLPRRRQTILCSATLKNNVKNLAGYALDSPIFIGEKNDPEDSSYSTPNQLQQTYVTTPAKLRLITLTSLLKSTFREKNTINSKIVVFLSCCDSVDFHFDLFANSGKFPREQIDDSKNKVKIQSFEDNNNDLSKCSCYVKSTIIPNTTLYKLHGELSQADRTTIFNNFSKAETGILFCTDVAARGLDLPGISKIIQYDPPIDIKDYVHRVGRTARLGKKGEAILFLLPSEIEYINALKSHGIHAKSVKVETLLESLMPIKNQEYEFEATNIQLKFERYILSNSKCTELAERAFSSSIRAYATHSSLEKQIFHIKKLHLGHIAKKKELSGNTKNLNAKRKFDFLNNKFATTRNKKPWIKNKVLNYLYLGPGPKQKPVRAQIIEFFTINTEQRNLDKIIYAEIHDTEYSIRCSFNAICSQEFECQNRITLQSIKGAFIIIHEYSIIHYHNKSSNLITLEIKKFNYSANIVPEFDYSLKSIYDDMDYQAGIKRSANKNRNPFEHPGWRNVDKRIHSMSCRKIPYDQQKILDQIPGFTPDFGWEITNPEYDVNESIDDQDSVSSDDDQTLSSPESTLSSAGDPVIESDEELSLNASEEQVQEIRKCLKRNNEENVENKKTKLHKSAT